MNENESQTSQAHTRPFKARAKEMHDRSGMSSGQGIKPRHDPLVLTTLRTVQS